MGELLDFDPALGLVGALLPKVLDDALVLTGVAELRLPDVEGADAVRVLDQEPEAVCMVSLDLSFMKMPCTVWS